jgi:NAD-reducing hydrogenase small subunit
MKPMSKVKVATIWMDGCSGCHMSFLDIDERLIELAEHIEIVYSPLVDAKKYPEDVDVAIIEGAVSYDEDFEKLKKIRSRTKIIVALGDCAVAGNVPTMRNPFLVSEVLEHSYIETSTTNQQIPGENIPALLPYVKPIHSVIDVDVFVQGCPPSADTIYYVLTELIAGRTPELNDKTRPGA